MSAAHTILDNLPSLCQNCQIWWKFDVVITKIILLVFWRHGVYCRMLGYHAMKKFRQIMRFATVYNTGLWKNYGRTDRLTETSRQKILRTCTRRAYTDKKAVLSQWWPRDARYISRPWAVAEIWPFEIIQDGGGRHLEFIRIENSAIRSAVPENHTL